MQPCNPNAKLETKCLHAGYTPEKRRSGNCPHRTEYHLSL